MTEAAETWRNYAACIGYSDIFFDPDRWKEARDICYGCPVFRACERYRNQHEDELQGGIWAGLSMEPSKKSKRRRVAQKHQREALLTA